MIGTTLSHYEILEKIGAGGMGVVYRAHDTTLGRDVAIKILPDEIRNDPERLSRFEREARLLASLNHPHVATLHGFEEASGTRFLVMELVEGETLADKIAGGPLPLAEVLSCFRQMAEGIEAAHEKGIIHRDLKPGNVKITPEGQVKVLDFGLAKGFGASSASGPQSESPTITRSPTESGVILGTAAYMSPEQARGRPLDKRTDIWSFGCCLFEALTGRPAFLGETVSDTLARILEREPDWEALPERTPRSVRRVLARCLTKDPTMRLHDIADAGIEIVRPLDDLDAAPQRVESRSKRTFVGALGLAFLCGAIALWSLLRPPERPAREVVRSILSLPEGERLQVWTVSSSVAVSPDGRFVAYVLGQETRTRLYLRRLDELDARLIEGSEGATTPFFSPDSQWLGFVKGRTIFRAAVSGRAPEPVARAGSEANGLDWAGNTIFTTRGRGRLARISLSDGQWKDFTDLDSDRREVAHRFPQVLPGGKSVLFTLATSTLDSWDDAAIAAASMETGEHKILLQGGYYARYSPTGHLLYLHGGTLYAVGFDRETLEVRGQPVPIVEGVMTSWSGGVGEYALAANGTLVYAPGRSEMGNRRVVRVNRQGRVETLVEVPRPYFDPRMSPDGKRFAIFVQSGLGSIWLYDVERGTLTRWTSEWSNFGGIWSPDGREAVFSSSRPGPFNLYRKEIDGTGPAERLTTSELSQAATSWSPDGTTLAFREVTSDHGTDIRLLPLGGGEARTFLGGRANEDVAVFSPDGRFLAYESDETGQLEIYVCRFPDGSGKQQVSTDGGYEPVWRQDGKEIFYRSGDRLMSVSARTGENLVLGRPALVFERHFFHHSFGSYDVALDGQHFVFIDDSDAEPAPTHLVLVQNFSDELKRLVPAEGSGR